MQHSFEEPSGFTSTSYNQPAERKTTGIRAG